MNNHDVNLSSWVVNLIRFKCPMVVYYEAIKWPLLDHQHILYNKNHVLWSGVPKGRHDPGVKLTFIHHLLTLPDLSVDQDYRSRLRLPQNQSSIFFPTWLCSAALFYVKCQLWFVNIVGFGCNLGQGVTPRRQSSDPSCTQIGQFYLVFFLALRLGANPFL